MHRIAMSPPLFLNESDKDHREIRPSLISPLRKGAREAPFGSGQRCSEIIIAGIRNKKSATLPFDKLSGSYYGVVSGNVNVHGSIPL